MCALNRLLRWLGAAGAQRSLGHNTGCTAALLARQMHLLLLLSCMPAAGRVLDSIACWMNAWMALAGLGNLMEPDFCCRSAHPTANFQTASVGNEGLMQQD